MTKLITKKAMFEYTGFPQGANVGGRLPKLSQKSMPVSYVFEVLVITHLERHRGGFQQDQHILRHHAQQEDLSQSNS